MPLTTVTSLQQPTEPEQDTKRLWIGNLDSRITEYHLLKLLQNFGPVEKFDLLFHKTGPQAGQPRGYAFVTFTQSSNALSMKNALDKKKLGNKVISVKWAHADIKDIPDPPKQIEIAIPALAGPVDDTKMSRESKISAIESKLKMMEHTSPDEDLIFSEVPTTSAFPNPFLKKSQNRPSPQHNQRRDLTGRHRHKPYNRRR